MHAREPKGTFEMLGARHLIESLKTDTPFSSRMSNCPQQTHGCGKERSVSSSLHERRVHFTVRLCVEVTSRMLRCTSILTSLSAPRPSVGNVLSGSRAFAMWFRSAASLCGGRFHSCPRRSAAAAASAGSRLAGGNRRGKYGVRRERHNDDGE